MDTKPNPKPFEAEISVSFRVQIYRMIWPEGHKGNNTLHTIENPEPTFVKRLFLNKWELGEDYYLTDELAAYMTKWFIDKYGVEPLVYSLRLRLVG